MACEQYVAREPKIRSISRTVRPSSNDDTNANININTNYPITITHRHHPPQPPPILHTTSEFPFTPHPLP